MKTAFLSGINTFDTAENYCGGDAESVLGDSIRMGINQKVWEREDLVVITKLFFGALKEKGETGYDENLRTVNKFGLSRKHIVEGLRSSLKRLNLDYVDVIMAHRPDPVTPIEEIVRAFNHCIDMGLAFYWGTGEWSSQQLQEAFQVAEKLNLVPPCADEAEYSLLHKKRIEEEYLPLYRQGLGLITWSPLASGILTGKYKGGAPPGARLSLDMFKGRKDLLDSAEKAEEIRPIAEKLGCSMSQLALAWCSKNKNVSSVIIGASSEAQMIENLGALKVIDKLTPDIMSQLNVALKIDQELTTAPTSPTFRTGKMRHGITYV